MAAGALLVVGLLAVYRAAAGGSAKPFAQDPTLFSTAYHAARRWGSYRPGIYFGVSSRQDEPLGFGVAWANARMKILRHECRQEDEVRYGWEEHDAAGYGFQRVADAKVGLAMNTSFAAVEGGFAAQLSTLPRSTKGPVSLFLYWTGPEPWQVQQPTPTSLALQSGPANVAVTWEAGTADPLRPGVPAALKSYVKIV